MKPDGARWPSRRAGGRNGEAADSGCLKSFNVVISCLNDDDKKHVAEILGEEDAASLKRFYKAEELL